MPIRLLIRDRRPRQHDVERLQFRNAAHLERQRFPGDVISNRPFAAACLAVLLTSAVFFAALLYLPQLMTRVLGYSALRSGAGLLPMMATFAAVSALRGSTNRARLSRQLSGWSGCG